MDNNANEVVNLFWTGGWDSTFRLLQLLLLEKKKVQPHYIVDMYRHSAGAELTAMNEIRRTLFERYPFTKELLLPLKTVDSFDIEPNEEIAKALDELRRDRHVGQQYDWLARYTLQHQLSNVEFTIEISEHESIIGGQLDYWNADHYQTPFSTEAEKKVFGQYHYPVIQLTKKDMQQIAEGNGWLDLMKKTWFCHKPRFNNIPCGRCIPCMTVLTEGLGWRIPWQVRVLNKLAQGMKRIFPSDFQNRG